MAKEKTKDSITSFTDLYERVTGGDNLVAWIISGHLMVEFLLRKLIQISDSRLTRLSDQMSHYQLILLNHDLLTITDKQKDVLLRVNSLRNKFAHQISYQPLIAELYDIYSAAKVAFTDLSDGIVQGLEELNKASNAAELDDWVIKELFIQIAYDLHHVYIDRGGDEEVF